VYVAFETKRGVLRALWHLLLRGDEEDIAMGERQWYRDVLAEPDPERRLLLTARNSRAVKERAAGLMEVMRTAAPTEPDIEVLWSRLQSELYEIQRPIVESLPLRKGLDAARAADVMWALNHPDVWQLLVTQRGWTPEQYERWLGETFRAQLL
jgi:hypothetical protein